MITGMGIAHADDGSSPISADAFAGLVTDFDQASSALSTQLAEDDLALFPNVLHSQDYLLQQLSSLPSFEQSIDSLDQLSPYNDS
jgi:hypothetical protein